MMDLARPAIGHIPFPGHRTVDETDIMMTTKDYNDPAALRRAANELDAKAAMNGPNTGWASQARALRHRADTIEEQGHG